MHENIKRFSLDGEVKYEFLSKVRATLERTLEDQMREEGFVPILDMEPHLTQEFDAEAGSFRITLSIYGAHVGEESWEVGGIMGGKKIMKYIPSPKSKAS